MDKNDFCDFSGFMIYSVRFVFFSQLWLRLIFDTLHVDSWHEWGFYVIAQKRRNAQENQMKCQMRIKSRRTLKNFSFLHPSIEPQSIGKAHVRALGSRAQNTIIAAIDVCFLRFSIFRDGFGATVGVSLLIKITSNGTHKNWLFRFKLFARVRFAPPPSRSNKVLT